MISSLFHESEVLILGIEYDMIWGSNCHMCCVRRALEYNLDISAICWILKNLT